MKIYVLTGPPSSGKTSLLLYLEYYFKQRVIKEGAEDYIKLRQAQGIREPWNEKDFQLGIFRLQELRFNSIERGIKRVFLDRSFVDGLAYIKDSKEDNEVKRLIINKNNEIEIDIVFFIEPLKSFTKTEFRRESLDEIKALHKRLLQKYKEYDHNIIKIPPFNLKQRADLIMKKVEDYESSR
jgi:predicted ATPase